MNKSNPIIKYKIMLLGNSGVGKSTYSQRLFNKDFNLNCTPTIGCDYNTKVMPLEDGTIAAIELWDTAGQERFISIPKNLIKNVDGIILMYDITSKQSLIDIMNWMEYLYDNAKKNIPFVMVGNKCDLVEERKVSYDEAKEIAIMKSTSIYEVSCKNNINIIEAFNHSVSIVYKFRTNCEAPLQRNTISLKDSITAKEKRSDKCCESI